MTDVRVPAGWHGQVRVLPGPRLLAAPGGRPRLATHRRTWPEPARLPAAQLLELLPHGRLRGRGGAGFDLARKVKTAWESGRRRSVVVNASEGEPGSAKDSALLLTTPHLVLDGADVVAYALGVRTVHVVVPGERPAVEEAVAAAVQDRRHGRIRYRLHTATGGFVGGQSRAVLELIEGRPNLPVTSWAPEAVSGLRGRPTLLSNAETYAQAAALVALGPSEYARLGTPDEPGTTLLTVGGDGPTATVLEVAHGTTLVEAMARSGHHTGAVLMGGYHGVWLPEHWVHRRLVLASDLRAAGASLGAGVVLPLGPGECPVVRTSQIVAFLAGQSARRCGPCRFGLPALAQAVEALADGGVRTAAARTAEIAGLVDKRGACAHPDGTARLVRSLLKSFPGEVSAHHAGGCEVAEMTQMSPMEQMVQR